MKIIVLLITIVGLVFGLELNFKPKSLNAFELSGLKTKIVYTSQDDTSEQIYDLWEKILTSDYLKEENTVDGKIYVVYDNNREESFECFIGIRAKKELNAFIQKSVPKTDYQNTVVEYSSDQDLNDIWNAINDVNIDRSFTRDLEVYKISDLNKNRQFINIYLSVD